MSTPTTRSKRSLSPSASNDRLPSSAKISRSENARCDKIREKVLALDPSQKDTLLTQLLDFHPSARKAISELLPTSGQTTAEPSAKPTSRPVFIRAPLLSKRFHATVESCQFFLWQIALFEHDDKTRCLKHRYFWRAINREVEMIFHDTADEENDILPAVDAYVALMQVAVLIRDRDSCLEDPFPPAEPTYDLISDTFNTLSQYVDLWEEDTHVDIVKAMVSRADEVDSLNSLWANAMRTPRPEFTFAENEAPDDGDWYKMRASLVRVIRAGMVVTAPPPLPDLSNLSLVESVNPPSDPGETAKSDPSASFDQMSLS